MFILPKEKNHRISPRTEQKHCGWFQSFDQSQCFENVKDTMTCKRGLKGLHWNQRNSRAKDTSTSFLHWIWSKLDVRSRSAVEQTNKLKNHAQSKNEIFSFGKWKRWVWSAHMKSHDNKQNRLQISWEYSRQNSAALNVYCLFLQGCNSLGWENSFNKEDMEKQEH